MIRTTCPQCGVIEIIPHRKEYPSLCQRCHAQKMEDEAYRPPVLTQDEEDDLRERRRGQGPAPAYRH